MGRPRKQRARAARPVPAQPQEQPQQGEERASQPWYRRIPTFVQWAGGVVGLVSATLGLFFLVLPNARPQPDPITAAGSMALTVEDPLTYRQYLVLERVDPSESSPFTLDRRGAVIKVSGQVAGYRNRRLTLRWLLIDESGGPALENDRRSFTPDRDGPFTQRIFLEIPKPGRYKVRVQLYPPEAERETGIAALADEDSETFAWAG